MAITPNNIANVSTAKGVKGGYLFFAPEGTECPTDLTSELSASFSNLGFVSEDGLSEDPDSSSESIKDMNGDTVDTYSDDSTETLKFTLIEMAKNPLSFIYGSANVTEDANHDIKVAHNWSLAGDTYALVFEGVLKNGRRMRKVIPSCKVTEVGELKLSSTEVVGREVTVTYFADKDGCGCYDYIEGLEKTTVANAKANTK